MKKFAVLVAGGQGTRMQGTLPKQFLTLAGKPVLLHTLEHFSGICDGITIVMHADYIHHWRELCLEHSVEIPHQVVAGGASRAESVRNGIRNLDPESMVAVHDAVRPLAMPGFIELLFAEAEIHGSAIPVVPVKDTLRQLNSEGSTTVSRDNFCAVQTPQVFKTGVLQTAFLHPEFSRFTDEASLFEAAGNNVYLATGDERNIKLTVPADLIVAEAFLRGK